MKDGDLIIDDFFAPLLEIAKEIEAAKENDKKPPS